MMRLYGLRGACSLAVHIVLKWLDVSFELVRLELSDLVRDDYLALNPLGLVPVLQIDDGRLLTQNAAILNYLADLHPQSGLGGDGTPWARANINRWLAFSNVEIHAGFKPLFLPGRFVDAVSQHGEVRHKAAIRLRGLFEQADAQLAGRYWLTGHRSIADPYLFVMLRWAKGLHVASVEVDLQCLMHLERFYERMSADVGVQMALRDEGLA